MGPRSDERGRSISRCRPKAFARASMGPRSDERGRSTLPAATGATDPASMGPRSDERGRAVASGTLKASEYASMGPRSDERGRSVPMVRSSRLFWLQWGRVLMNAEGGLLNLYCSERGSLQWGRVLMNAEGHPRRCRRATRTRASMGPRSDERGRSALSHPQRHEHTGFNGAAF